MVLCNLEDSNFILCSLQDRNFLSCNLQDSNLLSGNLQDRSLLFSSFNSPCSAETYRNFLSCNFQDSNFLSCNLLDRNFLSWNLKDSSMLSSMVSYPGDPSSNPMCQFLIPALWNLCSESVGTYIFEILVEGTSGPSLIAVTVECLFAFQFWYCELCVKNQRGKGRKYYVNCFF